MKLKNLFVIKVVTSLNFPVCLFLPSRKFKMFREKYFYHEIYADYDCQWPVNIWRLAASIRDKESESSVTSVMTWLSASKHDQSPDNDASSRL